MLQRPLRRRFLLHTVRPALQRPQLVLHPTGLQQRNLPLANDPFKILPAVTRKIIPACSGRDYLFDNVANPLSQRAGEKRYSGFRVNLPAALIRVTRPRRNK